MSISVATVTNNVERTLSSSDRTRSLDSIASNDKSCLTEYNEELSHSSCGNKNFWTAEISLTNGESYHGSLLGNAPEGPGSYIWLDGCKYEGEWRRRTRQGYGKLSWPTGALYEGEFSGGYIHGTGTYTRQDKMTYKGRWRLNLKHGLGSQFFPNGDILEGSWIQGTPEGPGKYTWANGNIYVGQLKGGMMFGKGTFTWTNGDIFEGNWLSGMMHGFGVYMWIKGGCYIGMWTHGLKDGKGTFYPEGNMLPAGQQLYLNVLRKQGLLPDLGKSNQVDIGDFKVGWNMNVQSRASNVSLERRWSLEVSFENLVGHRSSSVSDTVFKIEDNKDDVNHPMLEREYMQGILISELVLSNSFSPSSWRLKMRERKLVREIKRPGEQIIKGHRSYDLMISLQHGIRYTIGKITLVPQREVRAADFGPSSSYWMLFPKQGSQVTPSHRSVDFAWKSYCPMVFRNLRDMFKIDAGDYMISICGNDALRELSSPGKSGSAFFLSQDDRFMIKTLRRNEVKVLLRMLKNYHRHVRNHDNTLITKFFGLHRLKLTNGQKIRFVVMGNMFRTELRIHRKFDLKGSSLGRSTEKVKIDENTIMKDLDLNYCFYLEPSWRDSLLKQIEIDSKFLESENIMDYSLLLGVHYRAPQYLSSMQPYSHRLSVDVLEIVAEDELMEDEISPQGIVLVPRGADDDSVKAGPHIRGSRLTTGNEEVDLLVPGTARLQIQLGVNMPARAEQIPGDINSESFHDVYDVVLYLGIIDILQEYNISKKIEHAYKCFKFDSVSISAVDPIFYSRRFLDFVQKTFPPNRLI